MKKISKVSYMPGSKPKDGILSEKKLFFGFEDTYKFEDKPIVL
ncbi:hypothetical protein [Rhodocytophaga rosea]|nr:hypothetical protein [Rhodocytophaga rosea]